MSPQSPATGAWASPGGAGAKKENARGIVQPILFFSHHPLYFSLPPPGEAQAQAQLLEIEDRLRFEQILQEGLCQVTVPISKERRFLFGLRIHQSSRIKDVGFVPQYLDKKELWSKPTLVRQWYV